MGAIAANLPSSADRLNAFWEFLKHELTPYRGRIAVVARIVTASTLVMIICMTFRIPNGPLAAIFTLLISRESLQATIRSARALIAAAVLGGTYVLLTVLLVHESAMLRFLWAGATFFLVFYGLSVIRNYSAAVVFGVLCAVTVPIWDRPLFGEQKVETTLWAVGAMAIGSVATVLVERAFSAFRRADELTEALTERLASMEDLLADYAGSDEAPEATRSALSRLAAVGTSGQRRILHRSAHAVEDRRRLSALIALVGRLVDLGANLAQFNRRVGDGDRERVRRDAQEIAEIRAALVHGTRLRLVPRPVESGTSGVPLLTEIEKTISLIREIVAGAASYGPVLPEIQEPTGLFVTDALSNPKHLKFGLRGCLAAELCYVTYNALFWPGLATSIVTCVVTALTTIGSSRQKQVLRFAGAVIGGVIIGMGAQIFIFPGMDSIASFVVFFAIVMGIAAWFATASTRLSYLGIQIAVGFDLIHLQEFKFQTSLGIARDRAMGVLLGLAMMWVAYDLLWTEPAAMEMKGAFVTLIRMLAQLAREPLSEDFQATVARISTLRGNINAQLERVRSLADGILFEFGPSRHQNLAWREHIHKWQPQLRTLFLMRVASLKYRLQLPGFELPETIRGWQREYDDRSAGMLDQIADRMEGKTPQAPVRDDPVHAKTEDDLARFTEEPFSDGIASFVALLRGIDELTVSVTEQIATEPRT